VQRQLVITGDDFGRTPSANEAIEAAHRDGVLTSASLMVTGEAAGDALARARELPSLSLGLHLVLCDGVPAAAPRLLPDLVGSDGRLAPTSSVGARFVLPRVRRQLGIEIRAQLERFLESGHSLDHVDGHHHLHLMPIAFGLLLDALDGLAVEPVPARPPAARVRLSREDRLARRPGAGWRAEVVPQVLAILAGWCGRRFRGRLASAGRRSPERVYGIRATHGVDESYLGWLLPRLVAGDVEIFAHPDRASVEGRREEAALRSPSVREAIARSGFRLVNSRGEPAATTGSP